MNVAILGFGKQGISAYEHWSQGGNQITICDSRTDLVVPADVSSRLGANFLHDLAGFDLIVRGAPSIHPRDIEKANPAAANILTKVTSATNEFFRVCPSKNIIGVTGTKGKGTTCTLIAKMLEAAGKRVHLGGNIGTPPLDLLKNNIQPQDWVVLELANFQLIDLKYSPPLAVCLMVEHEHLDWHATMEEYIAAKQQLFAHQTSQDTAIYYARNKFSVQIAKASTGKLIPYFQAPGAIVENGLVSIAGHTLCKTGELKLLGTHNQQNVCAAATTVWQVCQDVPAITKTLQTFSGLPFRLEMRREVRGVKFYNDSFASAPDATMAALEAIPESKVLIIGGFDRRLSLERLADTLKKHQDDIQKVILIGAAAGRCSEVFEAKGFFNYVHESSRNMKAILLRALDFAQTGDAIVLSPGFASFDMFKNFEDRGEQFNEAVASL